MLLGAKGIATRGSWPYYQEQEATRSFLARAEGGIEAMASNLEAMVSNLITF